MQAEIHTKITGSKKKGNKQFAILIDPDKSPGIEKIANEAQEAGVDFFLIGGSILTNGNINNCIGIIKEKSSIPAVLFPGSTLQIDNAADALLLLSLISGRNPEMLIGKHVIAAPLLKNSSLEILPTGYMLIESGNITSVNYISNTIPIPAEKSDIAACTAMAGELLGLKLIYMDGGSGAKNPISEAMISLVSKSIAIPLIVGGGIKTPENAEKACKAGADIIVVGNAIEKDISLIAEISAAIHSV